MNFFSENSLLVETYPEHEHLLANLGKFKKGAACIYIKKLSDINQDALRKLIKTTIEYLRSRYGK